MKVEITRYKSGERKGEIKKCDVQVEYGDDWSADFTIATMVLPLLKKVKESKQGAPLVEDDDVPEHLRSTSAPPKENEWDTDANYFKRWDYVLDEILFAMQEIANDNENEPPYHTKVGTMEFGEIDKKTGTGPILFEGWESTPESKAANKAYHDRIQNGCVLFGTYFQSLWT